MSLNINADPIKAIVLLALIMGSIVAVKMTPVEITANHGLLEAHYQNISTLNVTRPGSSAVL